MKKKLFALYAIYCLGLSTPAFAVEWIMDKLDGSVVYTCEIRGVAFRVSVKRRRGDTFSVFSRGRGSTSIAGPIQASSIEEAARIACGEK